MSQNLTCKCGYQAESFAKFHGHKKTHRHGRNFPSIQGNFSCPSCGKVFTNQSALNGHKRTHPKIIGACVDNLLLDNSLQMPKDQKNIFKSLDERPGIQCEYENQKNTKMAAKELKMRNSKKDVNLAESDNEEEFDDSEEDWKPEKKKGGSKRKSSGRAAAARGKKAKKNDTESEEEEEDDEESLDEDDEEEEENSDDGDKPKSGKNAGIGKKPRSTASVGKNQPDKDGNMELYLFKNDLTKEYRDDEKLCMWRRDGASLLQKYMVVTDDSKNKDIIFKASSVYSCWEEKRKNDFFQIKVQIIGDKKDGKVKVVDIAEFDRYAKEDRPKVDITPKGAEGGENYNEDEEDEEIDEDED